MHATDKGRKKIAVCEQEKKKKLHHRTNKRLAGQLGYRQTARQTVKCSLVKKVEKSKPKQKLDENHTSANTHTHAHTQITHQQDCPEFSHHHQNKRHNTGKIMLDLDHLTITKTKPKPRPKRKLATVNNNRSSRTNNADATTTITAATSSSRSTSTATATTTITATAASVAATAVATVITTIATTVTNIIYNAVAHNTISHIPNATYANRSASRPTSSSAFNTSSSSEKQQQLQQEQQQQQQCTYKKLPCIQHCLWIYLILSFCLPKCKYRVATEQNCVFFVCSENTNSILPITITLTLSNL